MGGRQEKILILDSDPEVLIALERLLEDEGFETITTWDASEALALLTSRHFDLLLAGEHAPEVNCAELLRQSLPSGQGVRCIVLQSAARYPFEAQYLCALGAHAVISRWNQREVMEKVRQCLRTQWGRTLGNTDAKWPSSGLGTA